MQLLTPPDLREARLSVDERKYLRANLSDTISQLDQVVRSGELPAEEGYETLRRHFDACVDNLR